MALTRIKSSNVVGGVVATNVQGAVAELDSEKLTFPSFSVVDANKSLQINELGNGYQWANAGSSARSFFLAGA